MLVFSVNLNPLEIYYFTPVCNRRHVDNVAALWRRGNRRGGHIDAPRRRFRWTRSRAVVLVTHPARTKRHKRSPVLTNLKHKIPPLPLASMLVSSLLTASVVVCGGRRPAAAGRERGRWDIPSVRAVCGCGKAFLENPVRTDHPGGYQENRKIDCLSVDRLLTTTTKRQLWNGRQPIQSKKGPIGFVKPHIGQTRVHQSTC